MYMKAAAVSRNRVYSKAQVGDTKQNVEKDRSLASEWSREGFAKIWSG